MLDKFGANKVASTSCFPVHFASTSALITFIQPGVQGVRFAPGWIHGEYTDLALRPPGELWLHDLPTAGTSERK